jgi:putative N6-adenine-specific DNA methylase
LNPTQELDCFAVSAPGVEQFTAKELSALGLISDASQTDTSAPGDDRQGETGGVAFRTSLWGLYLANYRLRTASRVLVRLGEFHAAKFVELRRKAGHVEWEKYLAPGQSLGVRVTSHDSRLYHTRAVTESIIQAVGDRLGRPPDIVPFDEESGEHQRLVVRILDNNCTLSIDSSGEMLHRRGYRLATAKAPLRETLAAAVIMASGWKTLSPLLDPFCGSGTIPIEAALMAANIPPGASRRFAFMHWPGFDQNTWNLILSDGIKSKISDFMAPIQGSDRDAGAITSAIANAERAGVSEFIEFTCRAVSAIEPPPGLGWIVTNPPYGLRVSGSKDLRNLYAQFGNVLRAHCHGWRAAFLTSDESLAHQTQMKFLTTHRFINGGVQVKLYCGSLFAKH